MKNYNMEMMKNKPITRMAWQDTVTTLSTAELRKRPLTMQIRAFAQREKKKKFRGPESPLYNVTCPLIYIVRIFGLAPYEFDENELLVPSNIYMIYSCIWLCIYTYIIYTILLQFLTEPEDKRILRFTEITKTSFNYCVAVLDLLVCVFTRKQITKIWNTIQDYDEIVRELGYIRKERITRIWIWSTLAISTSIWIAISLLGMHAFDQAWIDNVSYMIVYVGAAVAVTKFSGITLLLGQRFNHLNEISRKNISVTRQWVFATSKVNVKIIEHLHNDLMIIGEDLSSIYSWSIMFWLGNLCFHSVSDLYFVSSWILDECYYWHLIWCLLAWITSFISQLLLLSCVCHYTSSQANCMSYLILEWKYQLYMRKGNRKMGTTFVLINRQLNFSAAGCFNLNLPLLRSIVASLTTYLVILLQFD